MADVPAAGAVAAAAFEFDLSDPARAAQWRERVEHLTRTDPDGGFVALAGGEGVGVAQAMLRDGVWCMSLVAVAPEAQSGGVGGRLLDATLEYGAERRGGLIVSSDDPRALTLYARADLLRSARRCPHARTGIRAGTARRAPVGTRPARVRGHDDRPRSGLLVAGDVEAASVLLIEALRDLGTVPEPPVRWITQDQDWAVQTLVGLGLRRRTYGALCVLGELGPLRPYIPSPAFA